MKEYRLSLTNEWLEQVSKSLNDDVKNQINRLVGLGYILLDKKSMEPGNRDNAYIALSYYLKEVLNKPMDTTNDSLVESYFKGLSVVNSMTQVYGKGNIKYALDKKNKNTFYTIQDHNIKLFTMLQLNVEDAPYGLSLLYIYDGDSSLNFKYKLIGFKVDLSLYNTVIKENDYVKLDVYTDTTYVYMVTNDKIDYLNAPFYVTHHNLLYDTDIDFCFICTDKKLVFDGVIEE